MFLVLVRFLYKALNVEDPTASSEIAHTSVDIWIVSFVPWILVDIDVRRWRGNCIFRIAKSEVVLHAEEKHRISVWVMGWMLTAIEVANELESNSGWIASQAIESCSQLLQQDRWANLFIVYSKARLTLSCLVCSDIGTVPFPVYTASTVIPLRRLLCVNQKLITIMPAINTNSCVNDHEYCFIPKLSLHQKVKGYSHDCFVDRQACTVPGCVSRLLFSCLSLFFSLSCGEDTFNISGKPFLLSILKSSQISRHWRLIAACTML